MASSSQWSDAARWPSIGLVAGGDPERQRRKSWRWHSMRVAVGSTNARMLIQFGFIERLAIAGDRRVSFVCGPNAFAAGERQRLRTMADLQIMAEIGVRVARCATGNAAVGCPRCEIC